MEALSCARLRLSIAQERFAEALSASAAEGGLRRTLMRALALGMVLEDRAGNPARQRRRLEEFLTLFAETDYAWAAVCERRVCLPAVERFLGDAGDSPLREPAEALLAAMQSADADPALELSEREREILSRLDTGTDKEIAAELDLTTEGVRIPPPQAVLQAGREGLHRFGGRPLGHGDGGGRHHDAGPHGE